MTEQLFVPPETARSRIRRKRKWIGLITAAIILAAGLLWAGYKVFHTCGWLGSGVYRVDGECVGVTDGSYLFDPAFEQVQKKIADENTWVRMQRSYVTVALLNPLTPTPTSVLSTQEILEQLEGAYTAQYQANHTPMVGDSGPPIQLVLANEGSTEDQWQPVVEQLVEMASQKDNPLVAVTGLGVSIAQTMQGAQELSRHDIPMVGAIIAADGFDHNHIPGFIRVSPTTQDYAKSLRDYLDSHDDLRSAILVSDSNSDSNSDIFTRTLRDAFRRNMADLIEFPDQTFTGGGFPTNASPGVFATITPNICAAAAQGLKVILYAGRRGDLDGFLAALENRVCQNTPLTIMTAVTKYGDLSKREQQLRAKNLAVVFSGRTDSRGWGSNVPGTPAGYPGFLQAFTEAGFDPTHLEDDRAILTHDAVLTAAKAVRLAAPGASPPGAPTARDVVGQLLNLNSLNSVPAAGGTLSFSLQGQGAGSPQGRPLLVFEFPSATPSLPQQVGPIYLTP